MNNITHLLTLKVDLTRRCNMNCAFCCKGDAENEDIDKAIIDKAIENVQEFYISTLQVSGGEPLLNPEMFTYLIDKLIEKQILIGEFCMYTNGTIRNSQVRDALSKIAKYISENETKSPQLYTIRDKISKNIYRKTNNEKVIIVISTYNHDYRESELDSTIKYYSNVSNGCYVVKQSEIDVQSSIVITGKVYENYREILPAKEISASQFNIIDINFDFIENYNYTPFSENSPCDMSIAQTISISTNGNVYAGLGVPYIEIDNLPLFNIMDCHGDFVKRIEAFCWEHPVNYKINNLRRKNFLLKCCNEHDYIIKEMDKRLESVLSKCIKFSWIHELEPSKYHAQYPFLNHSEIDLITSMKMPLILFSKGYK